MKHYVNIIVDLPSFFLCNRSENGINLKKRLLSMKSGRVSIFQMKVNYGIVRFNCCQFWNIASCSPEGVKRLM